MSTTTEPTNVISTVLAFLMLAATAALILMVSLGGLGVEVAYWPIFGLVMGARVTVYTIGLTGLGS